MSIKIMPKCLFVDICDAIKYGILMGFVILYVWAIISAFVLLLCISFTFLIFDLFYSIMYGIEEYKENRSKNK